MSKLNIKAEVESVLGRELIGHEKAIVAHFVGRGMVNPVDVARAMLERHLNNNQQRIDSINAERADLQEQLDKVNTSAVVPVAPESAPAVEVANEYTAIAAVKLGPSTHLQTVNRLLGMSHEVATMLARHESLAPVNVHSHGEIINDLVELTRRAHEAVKAYQLEVQGR